jgi:hypothetical protein
VGPHSVGYGQVNVRNAVVSGRSASANLGRSADAHILIGKREVHADVRLPRWFDLSLKVYLCKLLRGFAVNNCRQGFPSHRDAAHPHTGEWHWQTGFKIPFVIHDPQFPSQHLDTVLPTCIKKSRRILGKDAKLTVA